MGGVNGIVMAAAVFVCVHRLPCGATSVTYPSHKEQTILRSSACWSSCRTWKPTSLLMTPVQHSPHCSAAQQMEKAVEWTLSWTTQALSWSQTCVWLRYYWQQDWLPVYTFMGNRCPGLCQMSRRRTSFGPWTPCAPPTTLLFRSVAPNGSHGCRQGPGCSRPTPSGLCPTTTARWTSMRRTFTQIWRRQLWCSSKGTSTTGSWWGTETGTPLPLSPSVWGDSTQRRCAVCEPWRRTQWWGWGLAWPRKLHRRMGSGRWMGTGPPSVSVGKGHLDWLTLKFGLCIISLCGAPSVSVGKGRLGWVTWSLVCAPSVFVGHHQFLWGTFSFCGERLSWLSDLKFGLCTISLCGAPSVSVGKGRLDWVTWSLVCAPSVYVGHHQFMWGKDVVTGWLWSLVCTKTSCSGLSQFPFLHWFCFSVLYLQLLTHSFRTCLWCLLSVAICKRVTEDKRLWVYEIVRNFPSHAT